MLQHLFAAKIADFARHVQVKVHVPSSNVPVDHLLPTQNGRQAPVFIGDSELHDEETWDRPV